jgi:hypothetical protein
MIGTIAEPWFCKVLKRRAPGLVESNHFAVDHRLIGERRERLRNCRISGVEILVVPRSKMHLAVRLDRQRTVAVQLQLVCPVGALR